MKKVFINLTSICLLILIAYPYAKAQVIVPNALYSPVPGGARILEAQGNTEQNPAIGFTGAGAVPGSLNDGGGGNGIFRPAANTMAFTTSSTERMRISSGGDIGIGTGNSTPAARLQVKGGNLLLDYSTGGGVGNLFFGGVTSSSQNGMRLSFYNSSGTGFKNGFIDVRTAGGTTQDGLIFRVDGTIGGTERMRICANGNVGINNTAPATKLNVSTAASNDGIRVNQTGTTAATLSLVATGTDAKNWALHSTGPGNVQGAGHLLFWDWTTNVERMRIDKLGDVGIGLTANPGTYRLYVGGSGYYSGGLFVASDRRFKTNIRTLDGALGTVMRLRGVQYDYRQAEFAERNFPGGKTDGYVAQELREVMPELVQEGPDGYLAVNYLGVIPVLSEAVKELKTEKDEEIEALEARVAEQDKQIDELEARLARLEAALERAAPQAEPTRVQMSNQPNPFNGITTINCTIPANVRSAELVVTDMSGREITRRTVAERGPVNVEMNLSAAPSGTYVCTLQADGKIAGSVKMMLNGK